MADDKGSSGGGGISGWTAAEIIIALILAIALLSKIFGTPITPITEVPDVAGGNASIVTQTVPVPDRCALFVTRPKPLEKIGNFVTIAATATHCGWDVQYAPTAYVQIVDANGVALADPLSFPATKTSSTTASFSTSVTLWSTPASKTGYVVITIVDATTPGHQTTARIPITFSN